MDININQIYRFSLQVNALNQEISSLKQSFLKLTQPTDLTEEQKETENPFSSMPDEILEKILKYLPINSIAVCAKVNWRWNTISKDIVFFHFYKHKNFKLKIPQQLDFNIKYQLINHELRIQKCHALSLKKIQEVKKYSKLCEKATSYSLYGLFSVFILKAGMAGAFHHDIYDDDLYLGGFAMDNF